MAEQQMGGPTKVIYGGQFYDSEDDLPADAKKGKKEAAERRPNNAAHGGAYQEFLKPGTSGSGEKQTEDTVTERGAVKMAGQPSDDELMKMSKDELAEEATRRNVVVTRSDGTDGQPTKADYLAALQQ